MFWNDWNAIQLSNPAGTFDYLSTHFVVTNTDTVLQHPSLDFMTQAAFALRLGLQRVVQCHAVAAEDVPGVVHARGSEYVDGYV